MSFIVIGAAKKAKKKKNQMKIPAKLELIFRKKRWTENKHKSK